MSKSKNKEQEQKSKSNRASVRTSKKGIVKEVEPMSKSKKARAKYQEKKSKGKKEILFDMTSSFLECCSE